MEAKKKIENREKTDYYILPRLKKALDDKIITSLEKKDKDCVFVIDGKEGAGKSTLALQIGKYVDPTLDLSRVVFDAEGFKEAIFRAEKGQCVVFDEAFTGLSSRSSLSGINRALVSLMMQMRQKNLFVIIVLPTFFLLDKYVALWRTRALIHVYETGGRRGYFKLYNSRLKKDLYMTGQKTYSYTSSKLKTRFKGRFYGKFSLGDKKIEKLYRDKKSKALEATEKNPMNAQQVKYMQQRNLLIYIMKKELKMSYRKMEKFLDEYDFGMTYAQIRLICQKFGIFDDEEDKKQIEEAEKLEKELQSVEFEGVESYSDDKAME